MQLTRSSLRLSSCSSCRWAYFSCTSSVSDKPDVRLVMNAHSYAKMWVVWYLVSDRGWSHRPTKVGGQRRQPFWQNHSKFTSESQFSRLKKDGRRGLDNGGWMASWLRPSDGGVEILKIVLVAVSRVHHHHWLAVNQDWGVVGSHALERKTWIWSRCSARSWSWEILPLVFLQVAKLLPQAGQRVLDGGKERKWSGIDRLHHQPVIELLLVLRRVLKVIDRLEVVQKLISICNREPR